MTRRRHLRAVGFWLLSLATLMYFAACGSSGDSQGDGKGGSGGGAAQDSGGSAAQGSGGGAAADGSAGSAGASGSAGSSAGGSSASDGGGGFGADAGYDVSFTYDAPVEDSALNQDSACAASSLQADPLPLDMYIILDKSGSMGTDCSVGGTATSKWCYSVNALYSFFALPTSAGTGVALSFFSGSNCPNLGNAQVPLAVLPSNLTALQSALNGAAPGGLTPTSAAANGIATYTAAHQQPGRKMIGVLVTDGDPTSCNPQGIPAINQILANHLTATGIPTFVIGMTGATYSNLETLANGAGAPGHSQYCAGGISPCHFYDVGNGNPATFVAVLKAIQSVAIGCQYNMPTADAGLIDPQKIKVQYTPGGGGAPQDLPRVNDATKCSGDGWYYDNNANPTTINLCPATCTKVTADSNPKIDILLGCQGS